MADTDATHTHEQEHQEDQMEQMEESTFSVLVQPPVADATPIRLDGVSAADTVLSLRQLLAEYPSLACHTCYHLEVQDAQTQQWVALNDFVELGDYEHVVDGVTLRMVLEKYDARKVRGHVRRLRDVLLNPPIPQQSESDAEMLALADAAAAQAKSEDEELAATDEKTQKKVTEKQLKHLREIHEKLEGVQVPVATDLGEFYAMPLTSTATNKTTTTKDDATNTTKASGKKNQKQNQKKPKTKAQATASTSNANECAGDGSELSLESAKLPQCIKSIVFSGYNPPPGPRKLAGDLLYLEVVTADDHHTYFVTAHVDGFFVNRSSATKFDPLPRNDATTQHLLLDVLLHASPKFKASYATLLSKAAALAKQGPVSIEWMVAAGNQIGGKLPWNTPTASTTHTMTTSHEYNLNRAEDELCASFGMDERGVLRDWNEEYQCCRELPVATLKDQIIRSRVMYKIVNEFVDAATQGAVAIVEGHIPPINPMDDANAHVYVFNNIFFSLSVDGKPNAKDLTGEEAAFSSANRDLQGVKAFNEADVHGLHTLATAVVDYLGVRVIAQSVIPGILQGEAASKLVYGSVDSGKTIASNDAMHKLMQEAAAKLHIAERSIQPLGTDSEEETEASAGVSSGEATTAVVQLCGPVEAKGILGADGRMYVLDLVRITPKDTTYYVEHQKETTPETKELEPHSGLHFDRQDEGYVALLRPELVQLYALWKQNQARKAQREERAKTKAAALADKAETSEEAKDETEKSDDAATTEEDKAGEEEEMEEPLAPVQLNPNVFMKYAASTDAEQAAADEVAARDAAEYLQKVVVPAFVADIRRGAISPADGHALTELMHSCGINMRYLGRLASLVKKLEAFGGISKYILELLEVEMIARVTKHVVADVLNKNASVRAAPGDAIVELLNALLGGWQEDKESENKKTKAAALRDTNPNKKNKKKTTTSATSATNGSAAVASSSGSALSSEAVWQRVAAQVQQRFGYSLSLWRPFACATCAEHDDEASHGGKFKRVHKTVLLRRLCQRLGLRVASKRYDFAARAPFALDDISGVVPVVKHSLPAHPLAHAKQLLERGRLHLSGGALATAYELLQEASTLLFQVVGGAHEDAALCSSSLATVLYHAGDVAGAIAQQQRALALYTQLQGLDYHDTAFAHANLALFLHANAQTDVAVTHLRRAIYLLELCAGPHYPEISSLYVRMGSMCQDVGQVTLALLCFRESLQRGEFDRLQAANTLHQMAMACALVGGFRDALTYEKRVFALLQEAFGDQDPRVQEAAAFMARFTERAVEGAKGRVEVDAAAQADAIAQELLSELAIKEESTNGTSKKHKKKHSGNKK